MKILILAGGGGTRLWPLSRQKWPKQFLNLSNEAFDSSLLLDTIKRCLCENISINDIYIITGSSLIEQINRSLKMAGFDGLLANVISEPMRKNTGPAIALAAKFIEESCQNPQEVLAVLPADHSFNNTHAFQMQLQEAEQFAKQGNIVTLGIIPTHPDTGYGYIQVESKTENWMPVKRFVEKPDFQTAEQYLESGLFFWNAGIFLMTLDTINQAMRQHAPAIATLTAQGYTSAYTNFQQMPDISIDYAIMERAANIVVMPLQSGWYDLGSWDNVHEVLPKDLTGNVLRGQNLQALQTQNSLIWNESGRHIATVGIEDCLIIDTADALLIMKKGQSQKVKDVVQGIESNKNFLVSNEPLEQRSIWGTIRQLSTPNQDAADAPAAFQIQIQPAQIIQINADAPIQYCVQAGDGALYTETTLKVLNKAVSWQQEHAGSAVLQSGDTGLTLISIGGTPTLSLHVIPVPAYQV